MAAAGDGYFQDGPNVEVPRLVLFKLVTRSRRLWEFERLGSSRVLIDKERALLDDALRDLQAVVSEQSVDWPAPG